MRHSRKTPVDPPTAIYNLMQSNPNIIAAGVLRNNEIIYSTGNWDFNTDLSGPLSRLLEKELRVVFPWYELPWYETFYNSEGIFVAANDDEHTIIIYIMSERNTDGAELDIQRALISMNSKDFSIIRGKIVGFTPEMIILTEGVEKKINSTMKKESVDELAIERKYLPEMFNEDYLELSKDDGLPTLKQFLVLCLVVFGIKTEFYGKVIKFYKAKLSHKK